MKRLLDDSGRLVRALCVAVAAASCGPAQHPSTYQGELVQPVLATAPAGVGDAYLGVPLDAHFRPLQGVNGGPLFPGAQVSRYPQNQISHDTFVVSDTFSLDANIAAWHLFEVGGGFANDRRLASYRAFQIEYVSVLNDRVQMRSPPPGAFFYPWKVYYGHAYEAVFSGTSHSFHAGVAAQFRMIGGDIQTFAKTNELDVQVFGLGLTPTSGQAIFARTPAEIRSSYSTAGPAVPIFVEYRLIPGLPSPPRGTIAWAAPLAVEIVYDQIVVIEDGTWGGTPWFVQAFCARNGSEQLRDDQALPPGTRVEDNHSYLMNWHGNIKAVDGDRVDCGLRGRFQDTLKGGPIAVGRMTQPITIQGPGVTSGVFEGSSADTHYRVHYRMIIRR